MCSVGNAVFCIDSYNFFRHSLQSGECKTAIVVIFGDCFFFIFWFFFKEEMDLDTFQQQALEVRQPDQDFDPESIPQNGEEFLMKVIYERNHCPAVLVKPPEGKHSKPNTVTIPEINDMVCFFFHSTFL